MKKINVSNLIDLRAEEIRASRAVQNWASAVPSESKKDRVAHLLEESKEKLAKAQADFDSSAEKLNSAIAEAEGRASVRKINARDLIDDLIEVNDYLGLTKKVMKGTTVRVDHNAQSFPNAYKYVPESTIFCAEFTSGWFITDIFRGTCKTRKYDLKLSDTAKEAYLKNAESLS